MDEGRDATQVTLCYAVLRLRPRDAGEDRALPDRALVSRLATRLVLIGMTLSPRLEFASMRSWAISSRTDWRALPGGSVEALC
jgi:hypothetical protein